MTNAYQPNTLLGRPANADDLADLLRRAGAEGRPVVPWGAGTRQHLGGPPPAAALRLETGALGQIVDYVPEDLTITLQAGVSIGAAQELLAARSQWLPWDPPGGSVSTIGGLLASGAIGPLRLAFGTPRDWVLGMQVALGDGRLARSGSRVVKNVAGYDLHKLHLGALGTLGVIVEVTLKVMPLPERQLTLVAGFADLAASLEAAAALRAQPLAPAALALLSSSAAQALLPLAEEGPQADFVLLARYVGTPAAAARQLQTALQRAAELGGRCAEWSDLDGRALWSALSGLLEPNPSDGPLLRVGVAPAALPTALAALRATAPTAALLALPGVGLAWARWPHDMTDTAVALAHLRHGLDDAEGYAVVEDCLPDLPLDRWGPPPPTIALMRQLKRQWDPAGILNPGRFMAG